MKQKDLYGILGVKRNASQKEIKNAFKKLSMKYHPDRLSKLSEKEKKEGEAKFKEINNAYQILSNEQKKSQYDRTGSTESFGDGGFDMDFGSFGDPFSQFFQRAGFTSEGFSRAVSRGKDVIMKVPISIEELFNGCTKKVKFKKNVRCTTCHGAGGSGIKQCPHCHGTGMLTETKMSGFGIIRQTHPCQFCSGSGQIVGNECPTCNGTGFQETIGTAEVEFPSGIQNGTGIRLSGEGSESSDMNGENGSFIAVANYDFDMEHYAVNGLDVYEKLSVPYYDVLLGCLIEKDLPNGAHRTISINSCENNRTNIRLIGDGIKSPQASGLNGDYYYILDYEFPQSLDPAERKALEKIKVEMTKKKNRERR